MYIVYCYLKVKNSGGNDESDQERGVAGEGGENMSEIWVIDFRFKAEPDDLGRIEFRDLCIVQMTFINFYFLINVINFKILFIKIISKNLIGNIPSNLLSHIIICYKFNGFK